MKQTMARNNKILSYESETCHVIFKFPVVLVPADHVSTIPNQDSREPGHLQSTS